MRAVYNTTCDIAYGSSGDYGPSGVRYAVGLPCRVVEQDRIIRVLGVAPPLPRYLTLDGPFDFHGIADYGSPNFYLKWTSLDLVSFPSGGSLEWTATVMERVTPVFGTPYSRLWLTPLSAWNPH